MNLSELVEELKKRFPLEDFINVSTQQEFAKLQAMQLAIREIEEIIEEEST